MATEERTLLEADPPRFERAVSRGSSTFRSVAYDTLDPEGLGLRQAVA